MIYIIWSYYHIGINDMHFLYPFAVKLAVSFDSTLKVAKLTSGPSQLLDAAKQLGHQVKASSPSLGNVWGWKNLPSRKSPHLMILEKKLGTQKMDDLSIFVPVFLGLSTFEYHKFDELRVVSQPWSAPGYFGSFAEQDECKVGPPKCLTFFGKWDIYIYIDLKWFKFKIVSIR